MQVAHGDSCVPLGRGKRYGLLNRRESFATRTPKEREPAFELVSVFVNFVAVCFFALTRTKLQEVYSVTNKPKLSCTVVTDFHGITL